MTHRSHWRQRLAMTLLLSVLTWPLSAAWAATLRVASAFDPQTLDPHAVALLYNSRIVTQIYERDRKSVV